MKYEYVPNTIRYEKLNMSYNNYLEAQILYKKGFEKILSSIYDFSNIDDFINNSNLKIPVVYDNNTNFYRNFSSLNSKYIYLRNNIHIENLTIDELNYMNDCLINKIEMDEKFLLNTFSKVLFEGDFNIKINKNSNNDFVYGNSLIFELAYDAKKCEMLDEVVFLEKNKDMLYHMFSDLISSKLNVNVELHLYDAIPELFEVNEQLNKGVNI